MTAELKARFPKRKRREGRSRSWKKRLKRGRKIVHARLNGEAFQRMLTGKKKMEFRLRRGKWKTLQAGDTIIFTNNDDPTHSLIMEVCAVLNYPTLSRLLDDFNAKDYTDRTKEELLERIMKKSADAGRGYYTHKEVASYGILGIKVCYAKPQ